MPRIRSIVRALGTGAASVALVAAAASPASAIAIAQPLCDETPEPVVFCIKEEPNTEKVPLGTASWLKPNAVSLATFVGHLESYRVVTGPNSWVDIPCVILYTNGSPTDECDNLGLDQTPDFDPVPLFEAPVDSVNPTVEELADLYLCTGRVTATVAGFGPNTTVPTVCYEGALENPGEMLGLNG